MHDLFSLVIGAAPQFDEPCRLRSLDEQVALKDVRVRNDPHPQPAEFAATMDVDRLAVNLHLYVQGDDIEKSIVKQSNAGKEVLHQGARGGFDGDPLAASSSRAQATASSMVACRPSDGICCASIAPRYNFGTRQAGAFTSSPAPSNKSPHNPDNSSRT